ncbi:helix-turn-helix transcriptional regulator [Chryseobacterium indoltheticum]|uniref:Predicted transcriptional regulator n=1 Tax=Chryseobacterium indoltheticum TaxID=254 RepID=A0A381FGG9_9FLAO|nr:helix-turn-helix transcriptional regulator [Chryseobacterium indoltheticum]SUX45649.1 Predicted transcriptional regulator [Chryseobacterium indoltheticum]
MLTKQHQMKINRLKVILAEKEKTNKWLAEKLGKSDVTVSRWVTNEIQPSMETFLDIAKLLDIDVKDLINSSKEL